MMRFVEQNDIRKLVWPDLGSLIHSALHAILCCVYFPARAVVLNRKQFNSNLGCRWYLEQGGFLATDASKKDVAFDFLAGRSTVSSIVSELIEAL